MKTFVIKIDKIKNRFRLFCFIVVCSLAMNKDTLDESQPCSASSLTTDVVGDKAVDHDAALKELYNVTARSLTPNIADYMANLFNRSMQAEKKRKVDKPGYPHDKLAIFKAELNNIMKWGSEQATKRAQEIRNVNTDAEGLLEDIVYTHFNLLRNVRARKVSSLQGKTLDRPTFPYFLLLVFKRVASRLYQNPVVADKFTNQEATNEYHWQELQRLIYKSIKDVLKEIIPVKQLLNTINQIRKEQLEVERIQKLANQAQPKPDDLLNDKQPDEFSITPPAKRKPNPPVNPDSFEEEDEEPNPIENVKDDSNPGRFDGDEDSDPETKVNPATSWDIGDMPIEEAVKRKLKTIPGSGFSPIDTSVPKQSYDEFDQ